MGLPSHSYVTSPAIWDHTVLPATRHKWTRPALTSASKLVLDLHTPEAGGMEGWVDLDYLASQVRRTNQYTIPTTEPLMFTSLAANAADNYCINSVPKTPLKIQ